MTDGHDPPDDYQYNKLRKAGGSHRITLVKAAVEKAAIDPTPPATVLAHIPVEEGIWVGFDIEQFPSQRFRVTVRAEVSKALSTDTPVVGEYPVPVHGKLGSAITLVPKNMIDFLHLGVGNRVTTVAVAPGMVLFGTKERITNTSGEIATALNAARNEINHEH